MTACSTLSPYFMASRNTASPPVPSSAIPHQGMALPTMQATKYAYLGHQQPPGPGDERQQEKPPEGDVGEPRQDAQKVVGEEGEEEGQG